MHTERIAELAGVKHGQIIESLNARIRAQVMVSPSGAILEDDEITFLGTRIGFKVPRIALFSTFSDAILGSTFELRPKSVFELWIRNMSMPDRANLANAVNTLSQSERKRLSISFRDIYNGKGNPAQIAVMFSCLFHVSRDQISLHDFWDFTPKDVFNAGSFVSPIAFSKARLSITGDGLFATPVKAVLDHDVNPILIVGAIVESMISGRVSLPKNDLMWVGDNAKELSNHSELLIERQTISKDLGEGLLASANPIASGLL